MSGHPHPLTIEVTDSILPIPEVAWNTLLEGDFIFADHRFLAALEQSGSLGRRTGWHPRYLVAKRGSEIIGALPLFAKANSYGEYIFDWAWANAAEQAGDTYYPKLVSAIPFTPASGAKFLLHPKLTAPERIGVQQQLLKAAEEMLEVIEARSLHFLFITPGEAESLQEQGYMIRHSFQYHWKNEGWQNFDEFLGSLRSKRRSEIRRERAGAHSHGLTFKTLSGDDLTPEVAQLMTRLYRSQIQKMGGAAYLAPEFFAIVFEKLKKHIVFMVAYKGDDAVAGALNFRKGQTLYGRYWGCFEEFKNLHFELCYYRAIDWGLLNGIELFEAGAQGEHKFNRGFRPSLTLSAHRLENVDLARAVGAFISEEKKGLAELFEDYREHDPFQRLGAK
jgi:predicted N-acyltransferase